MDSLHTPPEVIEKEKDLIVGLLKLKNKELIEFNDIGWDSRVYVISGGEIVFKFPRSQNHKENYKKEQAAFELIASLDTDILVPKVKWTHPNNLYYGYEGIKGQQLVTVQDSLAEEILIQIGQTLGRFLKELHKSKLDAPTQTVEEQIVEYQGKYKHVLPVLRQNFSESELKVIDTYFSKEMPARAAELGEDLRLCHGDLGPWNIIISNRNEIGIIDLGDVGYYDNSKDFLAMKPEIFEAAIKEYGDSQNLRDKIAIRVKGFPIIDLPYYVAKYNTVMVKKQIEKARLNFFGANTA